MGVNGTVLLAYFIGLAAGISTGRNAWVCWAAVAAMMTLQSIVILRYRLVRKTEATVVNNVTYTGPARLGFGEYAKTFAHTDGVRRP